MNQPKGRFAAFLTCHHDEDAFARLADQVVLFGVDQSDRDGDCQSVDGFDQILVLIAAKLLVRAASPFFTDRM